MRIESVTLEDHRDIAVARGDPVDHAATDAHSSLGYLLEPGDHPQRCRLSAARGPYEYEKLAVRDVQIQIADGTSAIGIDLANSGQDDLGHRASS
jgi:hypothetical protein